MADGKFVKTVGYTSQYKVARLGNRTRVTRPRILRGAPVDKNHHRYTLRRTFVNLDDTEGDDDDDESCVYCI